jgi:ABC-2 type transport system ATP-binding protein
MEVAFQRCVPELRDDGRTVLLSSHILAELEALCDRVSIIRGGRVVDGGTLDELRHLTRTSVTAQTVGPPAGLADLPGVHDVQVDRL